jgi:hypothetical protein
MTHVLVSGHAWPMAPRAMPCSDRTSLCVPRAGPFSPARNNRISRGPRSCCRGRTQAMDSLIDENRSGFVTLPKTDRLNLIFLKKLRNFEIKN